MCSRGRCPPRCRGWTTRGPSRSAAISPGTDRPVAAAVVGALAAPRDPALDALLGPQLADRVRSELAARARRWAAAVAPGRAYEAATLAAAEAALQGHDGPVLVAAPDVPGLDAAVAAAALDDLAHGADVAVGSAHDARPYLLATPRYDGELLELVAAGFQDGMLRAFAERGLELGMLRSERRLVSAADAQALALDPLAPAELAALVRRRLGPGSLR